MLNKYLITDEVILWQGKNMYATWFDNIKSYIVFWTCCLAAPIPPMLLILFSELPTIKFKIWTMVCFMAMYLMLVGAMGLFSDIKKICTPQAMTITITNKRVLMESAKDKDGPSYIFTEKIMGIRTHIAYSDRKKNIGTLYIYLVDTDIATPLNALNHTSSIQCLVLRNLKDPRQMSELIRSTLVQAPKEGETLLMIPNQDADAFRAFLKLIIYSGSFLILFIGTILFTDYSLFYLFLALCFTISVMLLDMREDLNNIHYLANSQFVACKEYAAKETLLPYGPTQWVIAKEVYAIQSVGRTIELNIESTFDTTGRKLKLPSTMYMHGIRNPQETYNKLLTLWNRTPKSEELDTPHS